MSLRPSHRRVSTCRLQNCQGQAGILNGLARGNHGGTKVARGTKALLYGERWAFPCQPRR
jgi:hypothetical protein